MIISVCIPIRNAEPWLASLLMRLKEQVLIAGQSLEILIADSSSSDRSPEICRSFGVVPLVVRPGEFDHGGTRTLLAKEAQGEFVVFLTQDALPADTHAIAHLLEPFADRNVVAVCGRQLPQKDAGPVGAHLRLFNYPDESSVRSWEARERFGVKTIFLSDSFAAYRRSALEEIGWFPEGLIFGEDSLVCAKFIYGGKKVAYQAEAQVFHSHDYNLIEELRRYFDMGVFHSRETWAFEPLPKAEGEGVKFVVSEWKYFCKGKHWLYLLQSPLRAATKLLGYKLGKAHAKLPRAAILRLTMTPSWWQKEWKQNDVVMSQEDSH